MNLFDHTFIFVIAIVYPIVSFISFRRLLKRVAAGERVDRSELYRNTMFSHWTLFFVGMAIWAFAARPWPAMGFGLQLDLWFAVATVLTILGVVALVIQLRKVNAAPQDELGKYRAQFGDLSIMLPRNGNELARFYGLSITAGIVEEVLWRGFLIWYLSQFMPLWGAALVSAIAFGLAHAYQGLVHLPPLIMAGLVFSALFVISGSLWLPIIMHAAVDILQGRLAYGVMHRSAMGGNSPPDDANGPSELIGASG